MSSRHATEGLLSLRILAVSTCLVYFLPLCSPELPLAVSFLPDSPWSLLHNFLNYFYSIFYFNFFNYVSMSVYALVMLIPVEARDVGCPWSWTYRQL